MGNPAEDLRLAMRAKTDDELYLLLRVHSQDYTLQALAVANEELIQRQRREPTTKRGKMLDRTLAVDETATEEADGTQGGREWNNVGYTNETRTGWGSLILLCAVGLGIYGGYQSLDSAGWISHGEDTVISARSDWLVGESKECWTTPLNNESASLLNKDVGYAMSSVSCDDGPEHHMSVTFYGRKVQPEYKVATWHCTRNQVSFLNDNSFTCYQTGGQN